MPEPEKVPCHVSPHCHGDCHGVCHRLAYDGLRDNSRCRSAPSLQLLFSCCTASPSFVLSSSGATCCQSLPRPCQQGQQHSSSHVLTGHCLVRSDHRYKQEPDDGAFGVGRGGVGGGLRLGLGVRLKWAKEGRAGEKGVWGEGGVGCGGSLG